MSRINDPSQMSSTEQLRDTASQVGQSIRDVSSQVKDAAQVQFDQIRQSATDYYEQGREMANQWEQGLEGYVRDQPVKSILIACGVGCLLGILWRRS